MGVKRDADGDWSLPSRRLPGNICRCGARRIDRQIGLEATAEEWIAELVGVFREVRRVLRDDGTCWVNCGDAFRDKQLLMMPARLALALQADGWWLRSQIVWAKPNPMPESTRDRPTSAYEMVYLLSKKPRYFYDADAVREGDDVYTRKAGGYTNHAAQMVDGRKPFQGKGGFADSDITTVGRNLRNVWTIATQAFSESHYATMPTALVERCIRAGTSEKGCCSAMVPKLRLRSDLTEEQRARVYSRLGSKALV